MYKVSILGVFDYYFLSLYPFVIIFLSFPFLISTKSYHLSAASKAFGALKTQLFGVRHICTRAKTHAYEALVLSLLFYGSECWILSAAMRDKILKFHRRCIRLMCGVTLDSMRSKNIHHTDLEKRLRISDYRR
jgi:hypothetical protein